MNKINLENRVAIVTGGAQGFGLAITKRFIESGARVLIWDKDTEYLNKVDLKNIQKIEVDVSNYKSVENAFAESVTCLLYTSPSPRDLSTSRMPSSA